MHTFVSFSALFCPVTQRPRSPVGERPRCVTVPKHGHACWMMFSICKEQEHNFQKQQNIALLYLNLRKKNNSKMLNFLIELHRNSRVEKCKPWVGWGRTICVTPFSLLVTKSAPRSQAFLAEMLETGDENREPPLIGLPLSHYFLLLKYLGGWYKGRNFCLITWSY